MEKYENFINVLNFCRSVRVYNTSKEIDSEIVKKGVQQVTLFPNSGNMQWSKFQHITSIDSTKQLAVVSLGQPTETVAIQMVVVVYKDLWKQCAKSNLNNIQKTFAIKPKEKQNSQEKFALNYHNKLMFFEMPISYGIAKHEGNYGASYRIPFEKVYKYWS